MLAQKIGRGSNTHNLHRGAHMTKGNVQQCYGEQRLKALGQIAVMMSRHGVGN